MKKGNFIKKFIFLVVILNLSTVVLWSSVKLLHPLGTSAQSPVDEFTEGEAGTCFDTIPIGEAAEKTVDFLNTIYTNLQTIHQIIPLQLQTAEGVLGKVGAPTSSCQCTPDKVTPFCVNSPVTVGVDISWYFGCEEGCATPILRSQVPLCINSLIKFDITALLKYLFPGFFPERVPAPSIQPLANTYSGRPCPNIDFEYEILKDSYNRLASSTQNIEDVIGLSKKKTETVTPDIMALGESSTTKITLLDFIKRKLKVAREKFTACNQTNIQRQQALQGTVSLRRTMKCTDTFPSGNYSFTQEKVNECKDKMVCLDYPADDPKCGEISCSNYYEKGGIESPTGTQICWTKAPLTENRCKGMGECKPPNDKRYCEGQPTSTQVYSCGTCCYIKEGDCEKNNKGACTVYREDTSIGDMYYVTGTPSVMGTNYWKEGHIYCTGDSCGAEGIYTKNPKTDRTIATCGKCQYADPNDSPTSSLAAAVCKNYEKGTECGGKCKVCDENDVGNWTCVNKNCFANHWYDKLISSGMTEGCNESGGDICTSGDTSHSAVASCSVCKSGRCVHLKRFAATSSLYCDDVCKDKGYDFAWRTGVYECGILGGCHPTRYRECDPRCTPTQCRNTDPKDTKEYCFQTSYIDEGNTCNRDGCENNALGWAKYWGWCWCGKYIEE